MGTLTLLAAKFSSQKGKSQEPEYSGLSGHSFQEIALRSVKLLQMKR